jgi:hypothetical protein
VNTYISIVMFINQILHAVVYLESGKAILGFFFLIPFCYHYEPLNEQHLIIPYQFYIEMYIGLQSMCKIFIHRLGHFSLPNESLGKVGLRLLAMLAPISHNASNPLFRDQTSSTRKPSSPYTPQRMSYNWICPQ